MSQERETNLALFIDFDNVALGARDARQRFDIKILLQRVLEKGKILVKKAYADWHYYKEHMSPLHEAAIELIEIPMPRISGKNSADIKLVVDAMDLCYSKDHIDAFVIVSGDSDFSPLVSKLRENNKRVIGIGVKNSSSHLLINNCDEFMFYDDIYRNAVGQVSRSVTNVPSEKRELFDFLVATAQSLLQESRGVLYSSLIKDTMTRKQPDFNERNYGFSNFGDLLEEARQLGLLMVERDARAGGTWVVQGLGEGSESGGEKTANAGNGASGSSGSSRSSRRRRRGGRGRGQDAERTAQETPAEATEEKSETTEKGASRDKTGEPPVNKSAADSTSEKVAKKSPTKKSSTKASTKKVTKKPTTKKAPAKKAPAKKAPAKKTTGKKVTSSKAPAKKTVTAKKPTAKKTVTSKAPQAKKATKKTTPKKVTKKTTKKVTKKVSQK